jgi:hypothetical protein
VKLSLHGTGIKALKHRSKVENLYMKIDAAIDAAHNVGVNPRKPVGLALVMGVIVWSVWYLFLLYVAFSFSAWAGLLVVVYASLNMGKVYNVSKASFAYLTERLA